jgi:hypothetical protein
MQVGTLEAKVEQLSSQIEHIEALLKRNNSQVAREDRVSQVHD